MYILPMNNEGNLVKANQCRKDIVRKLIETGEYEELIDTIMDLKDKGEVNATKEKLNELFNERIHLRIADKFVYNVFDKEDFKKIFKEYGDRGALTVSLKMHL